jgi:ubiquinone/menaquinone biosynthesis C-methylase UbiE
MVLQTNMVQNLTHKLVENPHIYDLVQKFFGSQKTLKRLPTFFRQFSGQRILDVGAGTGSYSSLLPSSTRYIWSDLDMQKLKGFRSKFPSAPAVICDATTIAFADKSVDSAICIAVSHHMDDASLSRLFQELARVIREKLFFLDAVKSNHLLSKLLWAIDQGSYPRNELPLRLEIEKYFDIEETTQYQVYHQYFQCTCKPKN